MRGHTKLSSRRHDDGFQGFVHPPQPGARPGDGVSRAIGVLPGPPQEEPWGSVLCGSGVSQRAGDFWSDHLLLKLASGTWWEKEPT